MTIKQPMSLKISEWPVTDRERWVAAVSGKRSLHSKVNANKWKKPTQENSVRAWGTYLVFLATGNLLDAAQALDQRVNPEWVHAFGDDQVTTKSLATAAVRINALLNFVRATVPDADIEWLRALNRAFQHDYREQGSSKPEPPHVFELLGVGVDHMDYADEFRHVDPLESAKDFRDGLLIALMAMRSVRRRAWVEMDLDTNLVEVDDGYSIRLFKANSKTKDQYRAPVPENLVLRVRKYLEVHRPVLVDAYHSHSNMGTNAVFVTPEVGRMSGSIVHRQVTRWTKHYLGRAVSPQEFRRATTTEASRIDPSLAHTAAAINGHKSLLTGDRDYDMASNLAAIRQYGEILDRAGAYEPDDEPDDGEAIY
jgi:integrase/recombinase XerD